MDLSNVWTTPEREAVPGHASYPAIPSSGGGTTVRPPAHVAGRADVGTLGVVGQVSISSVEDEHRAPTIREMQLFQALCMLWRRWSLGPLFGSEGDYLEDGLNWFQSDHTFDIVSASGNVLTLAAPSEDWDARRFVIGTRLYENPLWVGGPEETRTRYLAEPILGTFQLFDEVRPHPNSVLWGKCWPMVVRLQLSEGYEPGDNFSLVLDQDVGNIGEEVDDEEDMPVSVAVRCHVLEPERWTPLLESRPMYCERRVQVWSHAQVESLEDGVAELVGRGGESGRIAYPTGTAVFQVERLESGEDPVDITTAFVAAGRVACTHESGGAWRTRVWLGEDVQGTPVTALTVEGQALRITWWQERPGATDGVVPCQSRCQYAREDPEGRVYCALHNAGAMDNDAEEWVPDEPTGLATFDRADCYQWSGGGSASHAGCNKFEPRVSSPPSAWGAFWTQLWGEIGVAYAQAGFGSPTFRIKRHGVSGLLYVGGGRVNREIEWGEARAYTVQGASVGYLTDELEWVTGLLWGSTTLHPALGPNYDDPDTWPLPGLLAHAGESLAIEDGLGGAWSDTTDPDGGQRRYGLIPAVKAEAASRGGRSAGSAQRLVIWRDAAVSLVLAQDGVETTTGYWTYTSEEDGTMRLRWTAGNPLGYFSAVVVTGVVAAAVINSGLLEIEAEPDWRTVTHYNTDVPPVAVKGTIQAGGTKVRPMAAFELLDDPLHGDGNNTQRGLVPGDVVTFDGVPQGFEVVRAAPFAGGTFPAGWNGDDTASPPTGANAPLLPDEYITGDAWGLRRDKVWLRPRDVAALLEDVEDLVGLAFDGGQQGVFAGPDAPSVWVAEHGSTEWVAVSPERVNYQTGEIVIAAEDLEGFAGPVDVRIEALLYDRRQGARAAHFNALRRVFESMDTFRVAVTGSSGFNGELQHLENDCQFEYGQYANEDGDWVATGGTWTPGAYFSAVLEGSWPGGAATLEGVVSEVPANDYRSPAFVINAPAVGIEMGGVMATLPDGAEIVDCRVVYTMDEVEEYIYEGRTAATPPYGQEAVEVEHNVGSGTIAAAIIADLPGSDRPRVLWVTDGFSTTEGEPAEIDLTGFAQAWLSTFRRSLYTNVRMMFVPPVFAPGLPDVQELSALLPRKVYTVYEPGSLGCNTAADNDAEGDGTPNPDYMDRRYTMEIRQLSYATPSVSGVYVTVGEIPDTIGDLPVSGLRVDTNDARNWRGQRRWSVEVEE